MKFGSIEYSEFYLDIFNEIWELTPEWNILKLSPKEYNCLMQPLRKAMRQTGVRLRKLNFVKTNDNDERVDRKLEIGIKNYIPVVITGDAFSGSFSDFETNVTVLGRTVKLMIYQNLPKKKKKKAKRKLGPQPYYVELCDKADSLSSVEWIAWQEHRLPKYTRLYQTYGKVLGEMFRNLYIIRPTTYKGLTVTPLGLYCNYDYDKMCTSKERVQAYLERDIEEINSLHFNPSSITNASHSICFSLTIFSMLKPLYQYFHIGNPEFVVQIHAQYEHLDLQDILKGRAPFWYSQELKQLCDYRDDSSSNIHLEEIRSLRTYDAYSMPSAHDFYLANFGFSRTYNNWGIISIDTHMGFPLLFHNGIMDDHSKIKPNSTKKQAIFMDANNASEVRFKAFWGCVSLGTPPAMPKAKLKKLKTATALPILLPMYLPMQAYPPEDCLTLPIIYPECHDFCDILPEKLWDYYAALGEYIAKTYQNDLQVIRSIIKVAYKKTLIDLHVLHRPPTFEEDHKACILSALYVALQLLPIEGRLQYWIQNPTQILQRYFCPIATIVTFINFVKNILLPDSKYHNLLFLHDETGIYLYYKEYWPAYEEYCKSKALKIETTAKKFRQELYKLDLIKPQYAPSGSAYVRFDYRKKHGDILETVLNLSPTILDYHK